MLLRQIYDSDLSQTSYIIGCQATGEAIVVDPRRDVEEYIKIADENGLKISAVTETHIHADYLSGTRELAERTGAKIYVSDEGGKDWTYGEAFSGAVRMKHAHKIRLGNITIEAVHTPGHTPEHMSFLVSDGAQADVPGFMLTGDFVFVGDVGRPDLLDEAAGGIDTRFKGARDLFASLKNHFVTLPDYVQVLPGHGAGSPCGKALGSVLSSTVGYERKVAWWSSYVDKDDEEGFVSELLSGQPDAHAYFARMKRQNKEGPAIIGDSLFIVEYESGQISESIDNGEVIIVDTRSHHEVHADTVKGALNIPGIAKASTYGGWVYDPERESRPLIVLASDADEARKYHDHFVRVGIDSLRGYITSLDDLPRADIQVVKPEDLHTLKDATLIDVRNRTEHITGHVPGSVNLGGGRILWELDRLPSEGTVVTYCQSGVRNSVVASALRLHGHNVVELEGSYGQWSCVPGNEPARLSE